VSRKKPRGLTARPQIETLETRLVLSPLNFVDVKRFSTGIFPVAVTAADVNGDGHVDVITANNGSNTVSVLLGKGNGTFAAAQNFAVGKNPTAVAVADVSGDGHPDLVVANAGSNSVSVLLGNGNGTFQARPLRISATTVHPG
jgi:hypothetical protein